jgi:hypothetical protein
MSNASVGVGTAVVVLMELSPLSVYYKARQLVSRHPETLPLVTEVIDGYGQLFDCLVDDYAAISRGQA